MEKPPKIKEIVIPVPWGVIAGKSWGNEEDFPVLCVHGIFDNCDTYSRLIPLLPKSFHYVCIDFPGHGKSSPFPPGFVLSVMEHVYCLVRVFDYFKWTELYFIGHSVGSIPGLVLASLMPANVTKVVLIDMYGVMVIDPILQLKESFEKLLEMEKQLASSKQPSYSLDEAVERVLFTRGTIITPEHVRCFIQRSLRKKQDKYQFTYDQRVKITPFTLSKDQMKAVAMNIHCPVLVLQAIDTKIKIELHLNESEFYLDILRTRKNVTIEEVEGDHDIHITNPERLVQQITYFFRTKKSHL